MVVTILRYQRTLLINVCKYEGNLQRIAYLILLRFSFCVAQQMCFIRSEQAENCDYFNVFKGSFEMRFIDQFGKPLSRIFKNVPS